MRISRRIINQCSMVKVEDKSNSWRVDVVKYEFYYYHKKVCSATFSSEFNPIVMELQEPWSIVRNAKNKMCLAKISMVEDAMHGVDIIDTDYIQALYMERKVTEEAIAAQGTSKISEYLSYTLSNEFAKMYQQNMQHVINSMNSQFNINPKADYSNIVKIKPV